MAQIWGARGIWEERECRVDRGREVAQGRTGWDNVETTLCLGATLLPGLLVKKKQKAQLLAVLSLSSMCLLFAVEERRKTCAHRKSHTPSRCIEP